MELEISRPVQLNKIKLQIYFISEAVKKNGIEHKLVADKINNMIKKDIKVEIIQDKCSTKTFNLLAFVVFEFNV